MWRDSTPVLRTRSRLHQLPVTVFSSSGRNQTSGACGTQTRSSSGTAWIAISGWMPGCWTIIGPSRHSGLDAELGDELLELVVVALHVGAEGLGIGVGE